MKIALSFPGCHRRGGVERIMFECARFLASRNHDVHVFADEWEVDDTQPITYHHVPAVHRPGFLRGPTYFSRCTEALRNFDHDVLNTHGCVCPTGGVQWVQSLHASWLERCRQFRPPMSLSRFKQRVNPLHPVLLNLEARHFGERNYAKVIATTPEVRQDLNRFYGVPEDDVVVVPNGFSPSEFSPQLRLARRDSARERLGLATDEIALLFVANELERKGYHTLLSALKILGRRDVKLLVVGKPSIKQVMELAHAAGVADHVIACGSTQDIAEYHAAADIFALPTQYEAFCLAILEALGSGLPVITSTVPGARDAIQPGVNGALVEDPNDGEELAEAILRLLNSEHRLALSEAAPVTVEHHRWPAVLARYETVLAENSVSKHVQFAS